MTTMTAAPMPPLSEAAKRVAARLVYGETDAVIAAHLSLSVHGVKSQLQVARRHVGCPPRTRRAVLVHALLTARLVDPPACRRPAPRLTESEQRLLHALTRHSLNAVIGAAVGVSTQDVRAGISSLLTKTCADNTAHLVGLAHAWKLFDAAPAQKVLAEPAAAAGAAQ
ncbi:sigma-70 family RNA polymerase sigma factor [Streptomyces sp. NPDC006367]|uniref:sigma-70 family RNA polymerase sigma factor n=1 Tax=unclassified Streptomyces TaxID=2593676 RepID=UPI00339EDE6F